MRARTSLLWVAAAAQCACGATERTFDGLSTAHGEGRPSFSPDEVVGRMRRRFIIEGDGLASVGANFKAVLREGALSVMPAGGSNFTVRFDSAQVGRTTRWLPTRLCPTTRINEVELAHGWLTERVRVEEQGVEQSWQLTQAVADELTLIGAVEGMRFVSSDARGLHFVDPTRSGGMRFGHATVIDAVGRARDVESRWVDGAIHLTVPADFLRSAVYPLVIDPFIGPEHDADPVGYGPGPSSQVNPGLACDGTHCLVAWQDYRSGVWNRIWATRVATSGAVVDSEGFELFVGGQQIGPPSVQFDGSVFHVLFMVELAASNELREVLVSPAGQVLGQRAIVLAADAGYLPMPALVQVGDNRLALWPHQRYTPLGRLETELRLGVIDDAGTVLNPGGQVVVPASEAAVGVLAASAPAGDVALVAYNWQSLRAPPDGGILALRMDSNGTQLDPFPVAVVADATASLLGVAVNDAGVALISWISRVSSVQHHVRGVRMAITPGGLQRLDPLPLQLATGGYAKFPVQAFAVGEVFVVTWQERDDNGTPTGVVAAAVYPDAGVTPGGAGGWPVMQGSWLPRVAFDGTNLLAAWTAIGRGASLDVYGARFADFGATPLDPTAFLVSQARISELAPAVAASGSQYLLVWADTRSSGLDLLGVRVDSAGNVLDPAAFVICDRAPSGNSLTTRRPAVAAVGDTYLVVWSDFRNGSNDVFGARVSTDGGVLDPTQTNLTIAVAGSWQFAPAVAGNGTRFLVVWQSGFDAGTVIDDIMAARVTPSGVVEPPGIFSVAAAMGRQSQPAVASNGVDFLVAWEDNNQRIGAARVTDLGVVADPSGITVGSLATCVQPGCELAVAYGAGRYAVAWNNDRHTGRGSDIFVARVTSTGIALDGPGLAVDTAPGHQLHPDIAFDGTDFLLIWDSETDAGRELQGTRLAADGGLLDVPAFRVQPAGAPGQAPALAQEPGGRVLIAYEVTRQFVPRVHFRMYVPCTCSDANECTDDACDVTATCSFSPRTGACSNDTNPCTADICQAGTCAHLPMPGCCLVASDCDDHDPCTTDACAGNACTHVTTVCDAGTPADAGAFIDGGEATDAGFIDGGEATDAGGLSDGGAATDAGGFIDAGAATDAGGFIDAGAATDAGAFLDGGEATDAGVGEDTPRGCGCTSAFDPLAAVGLLACVRARRGRRGTAQRRAAGAAI